MGFPATKPEMHGRPRSFVPRGKWRVARPHADAADSKYALAVTEIEDAYDAFLSTIPGIIRAKNLAGSKARSRGYIRYWTGRRRHFRNPEDSYKAFNALLQGGGAEVVKRVLIDIDSNVCDENCKLLLQVHDELVFEIAEGKEHIYAPRIINMMDEFPTNYFGVNFAAAGKAWGDYE